MGVSCPQLGRCTRNAVPASLLQPGIPDARSDVFPSSPEVALNQKVKHLIQKLGEAIHETVSESEDIAVVVKNIREEGFDVLLMLEATIGLNEVESAPDQAQDATEEIEGPFTNSDLSFLKSLRISVNENDSSESDDTASA
jgi:translation elongation factor EF-1beta